MRISDWSSAVCSSDLRIVAVDQDCSCRWRRQAGQQAEHGGFSAAGLAQHGNHVALADREAQVVDGRETALAFAQLAEDLADILENDFLGLAVHSVRSD